MIFRTCVTAAAVLSLLSLGAAFAATTIHSGKSNSDYKTASVMTASMAPGDVAAEKACVDHKGKVFTGKAGDKICVLPLLGKSDNSLKIANLDPSKSNAFKIADAAGEKACGDQNGAIYTDAKRHKICLLPPSPVVPAMPPSPPMLEPAPMPDASAPTAAPAPPPPPPPPREPNN